MKKVILNVGIVLLMMTVNAQAQSKKPACLQNGNLNSKSTEKRSTGKAYKFKNYKQKELIVKAAYKKLILRLHDVTIPKEILEQDKREFVSLMKGKTEEGNS